MTRRVQRTRARGPSQRRPRLKPAPLLHTPSGTARLRVNTISAVGSGVLSAESPAFHYRAPIERAALRALRDDLSPPAPRKLGTSARKFEAGAR